MDVVRTATGVDVADLLTSDHGGGLATDVARRESELPGGFQVGLDDDVRQVGLHGRVRVDHAVDIGDHGLDLVGLLPQDCEVGTVDPHHDGLTGAGQHLLDALAQVGLNIAVQTRIAVDGALDRGKCVVVVDADLSTLIQFSPKSTPYTSSASNACPMCAPQLRTPGISRRSLQARTEIRVSSPTDVPGWVSQCIEEVAFLEVRQQLVAQRGERRQTGDRQHERGRHGRRRSAHQRREQRAVAALEHTQQWRLARHQPCRATASPGRGPASASAPRPWRRARRDRTRTPAAGRTTRTGPRGRTPARPRRR